MKKLLNTLYVTTQKSYLRKEGETVVVEQERQVKLRLPIHTINGIVTFGDVLVSPYLLRLCAERGVAVSFLSEAGRFLARVSGPTSGNVLLRCTQLRAHDDYFQKGEIARNFLIGKLMNARNILLRRIRDHGVTPCLQGAVENLADVLRRVRDSLPDCERLRGLEGEAGAIYFAAFNDLITLESDDFKMKGRSRRPPLDPMNALLSFLYTILAHDCRGALEGVGLDPQVGFLHELRPGRASLALDLMEEFRAFMADRVAVSLVNLKQLNIKDFKITESGAVEMKEDARKEVLKAWQKKKQEEIMHPFLNERVAIGFLPHLQAQLLARTLRGDLNAYPPCLIK